MEGMPRALAYVCVRGTGCPGRRVWRGGIGRGWGGGGGGKKQGMGSTCGAGHRAAAPSAGPWPVSVWEGAGCRHLCVPGRAWAGVL